MGHQHKQSRRKRNKCEYLFAFLVLQLSALQVFSQFSLTERDSVFCLNFKLDSANIKGTYWIVDTRFNLVIDSSGFDNSKNFKRDKIQDFFDSTGRKFNTYDIQLFRTTVFGVGKYVNRDSGGYIEYGCDTVIGIEGYPESFKSVSIGSQKVYKGNVLVGDRYHDNTGYQIGQQLSYFDNGAPKLFYSLSIDPQRGYQLVHGPRIMFYKNGRIKIIEVFEYGNPIYVKHYNKLGIRTYYKKFGEE